MPKYAVLSDIHGNLEAFEAVLAFCEALQVNKFILLGDVVGYNADPVRCLEIVQSLELVGAVRGNHDDYAVGGDTEESGFNPHAAAAIRWTHDQLNDEQRAWLDALPYKKVMPMCGATAVHATLDSPETWGYVFDVQHATANFSYQVMPVCFCGHSHMPVAFDRIPFATGSRRAVECIPAWNSNMNEPQNDTDFSIADMLTVPLEKGHKYLFNIGSIGQPRNNDPRASFAIYDTDNKNVSRCRVPYDIATAQEKVLAAGLPERLAMRLAIGR